MKKASLLAVSSVALGIGVLAVPGIASAADGGSSYQAQLKPLNAATGSGTFMMSLSGSQATITERVTGLAATFNGSPYPHVQHIHIDAEGTCPTMADDASKDGVISVTEAAGRYGAIGATLSTSGDSSPAAATTLTVAPSGASFEYKRTITLDDKTLASVKAGKGVIVVHGLDPATLPTAAQSEPSDLVPSLPLAATSPALCGPLQVSQMSGMPNGAADTGGGSTAGVEHEGLMAGGAALLAAGAIAGGIAVRRRSSTES